MVEELHPEGKKTMREGSTLSPLCQLTQGLHHFNYTGSHIGPVVCSKLHTYTRIRLIYTCSRIEAVGWLRALSPADENIKLRNSRCGD